MKSQAGRRTSQSDLEILNSTEARLSLLDKFDTIIPYLPPSDPGLNRATLSHWDLRALNIFVDNARITSLIDWQDTWVGPLFMQAHRPRLTVYDGELMLRLPDYYEAMKEGDEKDKLADKVERSILSWYYGRGTRAKNPAVQAILNLPLSRTRREVALFASEACDGDTIPLRECLCQIERLVSLLASDPLG
jgi:hypothetical protein